jgi:hypothetical protein
MCVVFLYVFQKLIAAALHPNPEAGYAGGGYAGGCGLEMRAALK